MKDHLQESDETLERVSETYFTHWQLFQSQCEMERTEKQLQEQLLESGSSRTDVQAGRDQPAASGTITTTGGLAGVVYVHQIDESRGGTALLLPLSPP